MLGSVVGKTIGVLGGGQLGKMFAESAHRLGLKVIILDPAEDCPCHGLVDEHLVGDFKDAEQVLRLADKNCFVITTEIEHVNVASLAALEQRGIQVQPSSETIRIIQDKLVQKNHFKSCGVAVADFAETPTEDSVRTAAATFGLPLLLKSRKLAYDGRGNYLVKTLDDIPTAFRKLGARDLYVEKFVPFVKEIAVMVARSIDGSIVAHPVVETVHEDNILHLVYAPAPISTKEIESATNLALKAVASFSGAGIFGVEMFLTADGTVLVNEIAPRPHNSGHYTIEACNTSQFEQHLRAITGLPLGDTSLKVPAACMYNVLGSADSKMETTMAAVNRAASTPGATIHWYGKKEVKPQRKMGHITVTADSLQIAKQLVDSIRDESAPSNAKTDKSPEVAVIMGSDSDLPKMKAACEVLRDFGVSFEVRIISAHRTPEYMVQYAKSAHVRGIKVIIAAAGGAAHLPGMVASLTPLPVVGVPINITAFAGQDAVMSILQMPRGVPVATVAIDNSTNGALLAIRIIAASNPKLLEKVLKYQSDMESMIRKKDTELVEKGYETFLASK